MYACDRSILCYPRSKMIVLCLWDQCLIPHHRNRAFASRWDDARRIRLLCQYRNRSACRIRTCVLFATTGQQRCHIDSCFLASEDAPQALPMLRTCLILREAPRLRIRLWCQRFCLVLPLSIITLHVPVSLLCTDCSALVAHTEDA